MIVLRLLGRNCPEPALHGAAQAVTGAQPATAASVRARAVLARRERRDTVKGTERPPIPPPLHIPAAGHVDRAGREQHPGREASGVKAEWPRLGTRRGAQPANPTAARREAPIAPQISRQATVVRRQVLGRKHQARPTFAGPPTIAAAPRLSRVCRPLSSEVFHERQLALAKKSGPDL